MERTYEGNLLLADVQKQLVTKDDYSKSITPDVLTTLSDLINKFNQRFGIDIPITESDRIVMESWLKNLENDIELREYARVNAFADFVYVYESRLRDQILTSLSDNQYLVVRIFQDSDLRKNIMTSAAEFYYKWANATDFPPVTPETPAQNRLSFRETIRSCKGHIYWIDRFIGKGGLEFLLDSFDNHNVKEIKILTSLYNNEYQITEELRNQFEKLQKEMRQKGISLEMRVVSTKVAYNIIPHDRFILAQNLKYNVPSYTTVTKGGFSEIKRTTNDIPFMDFWNNRDSLDLLNDWSRIKDILDETLEIHEAKCSACGKLAQIKFKPDGRHPVYCKECLGKRRHY
ncbi:MAG TPA: CxxC-x17-CxxC domain-containing protein [Nitrososphaeraceae archaeon]|nr:CxxC-x17-CxxC domain-containing protein [Nitrososphaeraceae archaeon]